ncbi:hypothetical protein GXM_03407 [Nostoc sphaeroides CCNUC1]|uniref:Uncharacterized protein n=1 Tax=Nostoc sphaeroides CCNUC1 TaxID=2653204 RepID=A0A5P8VZR3_9NOSO|nr:hypothetical protein GXM_03407 [Nostoc sphaeroides CCNUC1]
MPKITANHFSNNLSHGKHNLQHLAALAEAIPIFYRQSTIARNN